MRRLSNAAHRLAGQEMFQILARTRELERQGREIIHFEIGDPDFDTPRNIVEACCRSLREGDTHYCQSAGLPELREIAADVTARSRGFRPGLDQILVTPGANVQIYYLVACTVEPGEEVIITDPSFVSYRSIINFLGAKAVGVPLREENAFRLNPDDVERMITGRTRMIIINSPHNPTGAVMSEDEMRRIYEIAEKHDVYLVSDEVYARMIYRDEETSFASPSKYDKCRERTVVVHSFSKSYAMTGWRIGGVTGPADLIERMGLLLETTTSCVAPFLQRAVIEALTGTQADIDEMVEELRVRRDLMVSGLNSLPGVTCTQPKGAFYAFPNVTATGLQSEEFTELMIEKAGVATCPGNYFGAHGEGFVRFCYATSRVNIREGIEKVRTVVQSSQAAADGDAAE